MQAHNTYTRVLARARIQRATNKDNDGENENEPAVNPYSFIPFLFNR